MLLGPEGVYHNAVRARAGHDRAHGPQESLQLHDLRLPGCAVDNGGPLRRAGGDHGVLRGSHAGEGKVDVPAPELLRPADDVVPIHLRFRAQRAHDLQMQVHGPGPQLAPVVEEAPAAEEAVIGYSATVGAAERFTFSVGAALFDPSFSKIVSFASSLGVPV